jgi:tRNA threonylcarbamoyladenosine biosynthesis protein TsaB
MKLLALDTSTRGCSVAVWAAGRVAAELRTVNARTHSAHLMTMIREALVRAQTGLEALDGFAVTVGPGSFTGLRIGISTIKGLAFACGKPCVGVSSLEALAAACPPHPGGICCLMDARKGQVYTAVFRQEGDRVVRTGEERAVSPEEALGDGETGRLHVGDGAAVYAELIRARLGRAARIAEAELSFPSAGTVARLAAMDWAQLAESPRVPLRPRYLRRSDAELGILPRAAAADTRAT